MSLLYYTKFFIKMLFFTKNKKYFMNFTSITNISRVSKILKDLKKSGQNNEFLKLITK